MRPGLTPDWSVSSDEVDIYPVIVEAEPPKPVAPLLALPSLESVYSKQAPLQLKGEEEGLKHSKLRLQLLLSPSSECSLYVCV